MLYARRKFFRAQPSGSFILRLLQAAQIPRQKLFDPASVMRSLAPASSPRCSHVGRAINSSARRRVGRECGGGPGHASSFVGGGVPDKGNSRSPSPSFCSPVIGPLNLDPAASAVRFLPKPCAGRWNVPAFGSRTGARTRLSSCMAWGSLSKPAGRSAAQRIAAPRGQGGRSPAPQLASQK
jgi:hypothetical protein